MLLFTVDRASVDSAAEHIDNIKDRFIVGIRLGMRDGVRGLAQAESEAVAGHFKTGLLDRILTRAGRVFETDAEIAAVYQPRNAGKQPHYWLQYGVQNRPVFGQLMAIPMTGKTIFRMRRSGFVIPPKPFFFNTAEAYKGQFFERLQARVTEALNA